ncbi:EFR1 family ferrodoxin [Clostridium chromiireducens]|uniref:EFR1 family ferrodoxin n=1 Tax=Clostridium chromiireducens TaxID=225345 RepID=UPI003AF51B89
MSTTIYFFTGSGNTFKVAKDISAQIEDTKLIQICKDNLSITSDTSSDKIGFVYPVYATGIPWMVKKFIENLKINKDTYIFSVASCGTNAGISVNQIDDILNRKGTSISASFEVLMPGSHQVMYDVPSKEIQMKCFNDEKVQVLKVSESIKRKELHKSNKAVGIKKSIDTFLYKSFFNPSDWDKNFWTTEKCNGCGTCSRVCPANNIDIVDAKPQWKHQCEHCMACMQWCPQKAIQYKKKTLKRGRYHHPEIKANELYKRDSSNMI